MTGNLPRNTNLIPPQTLKRLPNYYNYLSSIQKQNVIYISAANIAKELNLNEVQVRKDLAMASISPGKPRKGFEVELLIKSIADCLGYNNNKDSILVGAGSLGKALLSYEGFESNGVRIISAFDIDENLIDTTISGKSIFSMEKLSSLCQEKNILIGIIAVPAPQAQEVCDSLVENGILAIWNFAPVHLKVPDTVKVQNENLSMQLALLSRHLSD